MEGKYGKTLMEEVKKCEYVAFSSAPYHEEEIDGSRMRIFEDSRVPEGGVWWVKSAKIASFIG